MSSPQASSACKHHRGLAKDQLPENLPTTATSSSPELTAQKVSPDSSVLSLSLCLTLLGAAQWGTSFLEGVPLRNLSAYCSGAIGQFPPP